MPVIRSALAPHSPAPVRVALRDLSQAVRLLCTWARATYPGSLSDELNVACERRIRSAEQIAALDVE